MDKTIIVRWYPEEQFSHEAAMFVIESNHPRFVKGDKFDFGFFRIATDDGYSIISLPMKDNGNDK